MLLLMKDGEVRAAFSSLISASRYLPKTFKIPGHWTLKYEVPPRQTHTPLCFHPQHTTARNITAYIDKQGYLSNLERVRNAPDRSPVLDKHAIAKKYNLVTFCSRCEFVIHHDSAIKEN